MELVEQSFTQSWHICSGLYLRGKVLGGPDILTKLLKKRPVIKKILNKH